MYNFVYLGTYNSLLRLLVAEFTLTENPANTTTSLLRSLCHSNDSIILGFWLQETDHKAIEDQVCNLPFFCEYIFISFKMCLSTYCDFLHRHFLDFNSFCHLSPLSMKQNNYLHLTNVS